MYYDSTDLWHAARRFPWLRNERAAWIFQLFAIDVLECEVCHGRLRILAAIHPPRTTRVILEHLGLPSRAPPLAAATVDDPFPAE